MVWHTHTFHRTPHLPLPPDDIGHHLRKLPLGDDGYHESILVKTGEYMQNKSGILLRDATFVCAICELSITWYPEKKIKMM
jgi:hypothetical protein